MNRILNQQGVIAELSNRTGWSKSHMEYFLDVFEEFVIDVINNSTVKEDSKATIFSGFIVGGHKDENREVFDPRSGERILSDKCVVPYVRFTRSFRDKFKKGLTEDSACMND